jgi:hypothetical protein
MPTHHPLCPANYNNNVVSVAYKMHYNTIYNPTVIADVSCSICNEPLTDAVAFKLCKHPFHKECIDEWLKNHTTCPNCRKDYKKQIKFDKNMESTDIFKGKHFQRVLWITISNQSCREKPIVHPFPTNMRAITVEGNILFKCEITQSHAITDVSFTGNKFTENVNFANVENIYCQNTEFQKELSISSQNAKIVGFDCCNFANPLNAIQLFKNDYKNLTDFAYNEYYIDATLKSLIDVDDMLPPHKALIASLPPKNHVLLSFATMTENEKQAFKNKFGSLENCSLTLHKPTKFDNTIDASPIIFDKTQTIVVQNVIFRKLPVFNSPQLITRLQFDKITTELIPLLDLSSFENLVHLSIENMRVKKIILPTTDKIRGSLVIRNTLIEELNFMPTRLCSLYLNNNRLKSLPELPYSCPLNNECKCFFAVVNVSHNYLKELPTVPPSCRRLIASHNQLTNADNIDKYDYFDYINLANNKLTKFAVSIGYTGTKIELQNNQLTEFAIANIDKSCNEDYNEDDSDNEEEDDDEEINDRFCRNLHINISNNNLQSFHVPEYTIYLNAKNNPNLKELCFHGRFVPALNRLDIRGTAISVLSTNTSNDKIDVGKFKSNEKITNPILFTKQKHKYQCIHCTEGSIDKIYHSINYRVYVPKPDVHVATANF